MKIGILSDTHDNMGNLLKAKRLFRDQGITTLIHCGDMTSASTARQIVDFDVIYVNGNMDNVHAVNDTLWMLNNNCEVPGLVYTGKISGVKIAATHGHRQDKLDQLLRWRRYNFVLHGHTHRQRDEMIGKTRVINPGALGGARYGPRTICVLDLENREVEFITVADF